jgi:hypothetical protein
MFEYFVGWISLCYYSFIQFLRSGLRVWVCKKLQLECKYTGTYPNA